MRGDGDNDDSISQCKWCKRTEKQPQTLNHLKQSKPYICWRRRGGLECAICAQVLSTDPDLKEQDRNAVLAKVDADLAGQQWFDSKVSAYEDLKNRGVKKVETRTGGKEKITARNSNVQESRQFMGYFYPTRWWMQVVSEGTKPERARMTTHYHQGRKLAGVLEKEPGPDKTKVFEVWSIGQTSIDRQAELAHSSTTSADDMNTIHDAANKRIRVQAFATKDGGMKLSHGTSSFKSPGDADADDAIIDTVFRRYEFIDT